MPAPPSGIAQDIAQAIARLRVRLHGILEGHDPDDRVARRVNGALFALILLNVLAVILESAAIDPMQRRVLATFETFSMLVFTVEYLARLWSCRADPCLGGSALAYLRYMARPMAIIDLLAVLPFWLSLAGIDAVALRMLRIFRLLKFTRLIAYFAAYRFIAEAVASRKHELLVSFALMLMTLLVAATLMFYAESTAQPQAFSSIPAAFWWGVITFTSVGYGDIYPVTPIGKLCGALFAVIGISVFALPTAILTAAMMDRLHQDRLADARDPPTATNNDNNPATGGNPP